jgi:hypothetical protein
MPIDGLKPTGKRFEGVRYIVQAHYPNRKDYRELSVSNRPYADRIASMHAARGANVQITEWVWVESFIAAGYLPAAKGQLR